MFTDLFLSILQSYLPISQSQCLLKTSVYIISLVFSLAQVSSVFNGTDTIALLGPKIWDLVLLEAKPKKYLNIFKNTITCKYYTTCIV